MVVPNIRNPNRYRTLQVATSTKSQYHLEPDHAFAYRHVGRRTKGGTGGGGGFLYSSGAYGSNGSNGTGNGGAIAILVASVGLCLACFFIPFACKKRRNPSNRHNREMHSTRDSIYRQRNQRANNDNNNNNRASNDNVPSHDSIDFYFSPHVFNSPPTRSVNQKGSNVSMKSNFYCQTVLPDKSNVDPNVLREEDDIDTASDDEDSVIENGDATGKRGSTNKDDAVVILPRFLVPTWGQSIGANAECSICLQMYEPGQTICLAKNTKCKHVFHQDCIEEWLKDHSDCPLCRVRLVCKPLS
ncbi:unnamed protein product [Cylindrotheca closterium]|uniref:RING-type domain-containing protein n=1 Tax=Cylindrotheca closterium TaxID=2856 RepID=A0AAD2CQA0_9STRA|nr:unnamed protein product [Cylindrotheca closterium]